MTINECIKQLRDLKNHCESMSNEDFDIWNKDIAALDIAIKILNGSPIEMNPMSDDEKKRLLELLESEKGTIMCLALPAADVAPVMYGHWISVGDGYKCSVCGCLDSNCEDWYHFHNVLNQNYCPNCGAKMDGEEE